jgi:hypothetical protein
MDFNWGKIKKVLCRHEEFTQANSDALWLIVGKNSNLEQAMAFLLAMGIITR